MQASDLDYETESRGELPGAYDEWPVGPGDGRFNRRQDGPPGAVVLDVRVEHGYVVVETMPETDEETGGFEGRYGPWTPQNIDSGPMADYQPDTRDQLGNDPLGLNGPYEVFGNTIQAADLPGGTWPADADLTAKQARDWAAARGDQHTAALFEQIDTEING